MQTKYTEYKIKDLVDLGIIERPLDGNHGEIHPKGDDFISTGVPFIMSSDINNGVIDFKNCKFISKEQAKTLRKGFSIKGDVLLTHKASIGRTAIVPQINTDFILLTPQVTYYRIKDNNKLNNGYLKYYFDSKSFQSVLAAFSGAGSTRSYIGIIEQLNLPIRLPDINTQQKIASVLSALDAKIELNNQINAELEKMAKTIYDYWFVQFDFPDANGKPYKSSGGKMVWNEELKREIPTGWEVLDLDKIENNIITGKTPSTSNDSYFDGDVPFICIGDVRGNMHIVETEITLTQAGAESQNNKFIPKGSICVTCIASPGLVAFATRDSQTNQQLNSIVCEYLENRYYLYFYLTDYFKYAKAKTGNTFANMNKGDFSVIKVLKPSKELLINFCKILDSSIDKILNNSLENQTLAELRDWLLPMLMNGQVKVD